jgi:hypothetical protein
MVQLVKLGPLGHPQCIAKWSFIFAFFAFETSSLHREGTTKSKKKRKGNQSTLLLRCQILPLLIKYYIYPIATSRA